MTPKRVDANQAAVVDALRRCGCSVQVLSDVGKGCVDIMVGRLGVTYCLEIKDGSQPPSKRKLTPDELEWHANWKGHAVVVESVEDALKEVGAI